MKLITTNNNDCVAASLAMLIDAPLGYVKIELFTALTKPFPGQWSGFLKVPDMNVICDWLWGERYTALTPFEYDPQCTPHRSCPPVSVYPRTTSRPHETADGAFSKQMDYGPGLIEGTIIGREVGHMCAWDGKAIHDPRGYIYSRNVAKEKFGYQISRFWLAVKGKTL
jgi:hypothetical protein